MPNRLWPRLHLLALLALTLVLLPQPAGAKAPAPLIQSYAYNCTIIYGDLAPDKVTCNGATLSGDKRFYTARVAAGSTISISGTVTGLSSLFSRNTAYLRIESVSGTSVREWREIYKSGTVSWTNSTGAAQDIKLIWQSNGPFSSYRVQGVVLVN
jgi:hypothetical protein